MSSVEPEVHEQVSHAQVADLAGRRAYEQAWRQFAQGADAEEFCSSWLLIQSHIIGGVSDGVVVLLKPGTTAFAPVAFYPENPRDRTHLAKISERALKERARRRRVAGSSRGRRGAGARATSSPIRCASTARSAASLASTSSGGRRRSCSRRCATCSGARAGSRSCCGATPTRWRPKGSRLKLALDAVATLLEQPGLGDSAPPSRPSWRPASGATASRSGS